MRIRKIMIVLLITVFLLSIASVCASDVDDTLTSDDKNTVIELSDENLKTSADNVQTIDETIGERIDERIDEETLSSTDDEIVTAEKDLEELRDGESTFSQLSTELASAGDVRLNYGLYTYDHGNTIEITGSGRTINGNGAIIDMAGSNIRAFNVTGNGISIINLTIKNANYTGNGSAIYFSNPGLLENCNFIENTGENGGAVYFEIFSKIEYCSFIGNSAVLGGALYSKSAAELKNCTFEYNHANDGAAAFFNSVSELTNCTFNDNTAENNGTAYFNSSNSKIQNCSFNGNNATNGAAAYFNADGEVNNCNFTNNNASYCGTIFFNSNNSKLENSCFNGNNATNGAGAFFNDKGKVKNCNFTNNNASLQGGGIFFRNEGELMDCNFDKNYAYHFGSSICFVTGLKSSLKNCNFTNNLGPFFGAVHSLYDMTLEDCNFINNIILESGVGGALQANNGNLTNCNFVNNSAIMGGAIFFNTYGELRNCTFDNNNAVNSAGALFIRRGNLENCNFTNSFAEIAGAISMDEGQFKNCSFANNRAGHRGGAIWIGDGIFEDCSFDKNIASEEGGAIFIDGGTIKNCNFTSNKASEGGAVCIHDVGEVIGCNFDDNSAGNGGAILADTATIENCNFTNNWATAYGGAIYFEGKSDYRDRGTINHTNFNSNEADSGGAIATDGKLTVQNTVFDGNNATDGINNILLVNGDEELVLDNVTPGYLGPFVKVYLTKLNAKEAVYGNPVEITVMAVTKSDAPAKDPMTSKNGISLKDTSSNIVKNDVPVKNGTVYVYIFNGGIYRGEIIDGIAKISIPGLNAGTYYGIVIYEGGTIFNRPTEFISFKVTKQNAGIAANNKAYVINYGGNYIINLKDATGRPISGKSVTFKLNGKNIGSTTTNAAGVATFKLTGTVLKSVKSGKKNLAIEFTDNNYNTVSITAKISVSKEKTKLVAKNKKFKKSTKIKKYTVTLKNSKG
ncbi:right-handed parallel beta-helix repeat-containing protein, partial [Methanobrevibacter sp.]|uniref:right-handed parallel beta-helix repeat-containing protein n=1 Tax=Methanobrevibacter sp. TaxID=66852 RepID=UPI003864E8BD